MKKPIMVTRPFLPPREEFDRYVDTIWETQWLTNQGPLHEEFAQVLQTFLGVPYTTLTVNGHLALEIALRALGIQGEVITTPFTFASTAHALSLCGIKPIFADIKESDFTLDPQKAEALITDKTTAIMPVHVYGHLCDTDAFEALAKKYKIKIIYDAAHAFGVKKNGVSSGAFGDISMFSFHATKLFHSIEGGVLAYHNAGYQRLLNAYKNFGIENEESIPFVGGNAKMNEFQAAMGLACFNHIEDIIAERRGYTQRYFERLCNLPGLHFSLPEKGAGMEYNYAYMPVRIEANVFGMTRDELCTALKKDGIITRKYFYPIVTEFSCYRHLNATAQVPLAYAAGQQVMTLPLYCGMGEETVDFVCDSIIKNSRRRVL